MFASKTVREHVLRGTVGLGAVALALNVPMLALPAWSELPAMALLLGGGMLALRGCPMCWLYGLGETLVAAVRGQAAPDACVDGACAARARAKPSIGRMWRDLLGPPP